MSRVLLIFSLLLATTLPLFAVDPSEQFLSAYQCYQQAENLERSGNTAEAINKYRFAESLLAAISKSDPSWQKPVIEYRLKKTHESLERLQSGSADAGGGADNTLSTIPALAPSSGSGSSSPHPSGPISAGPSITITPPGSSSQNSSEAPVPSTSENRRLRLMIEDLKGQVQEAHDALVSQKRRTSDLENAEWVKKRSQLVSDLDIANRRISDLERDLKSRDSWGTDLKNLQKKLDDAVADKLASEEQFQGNVKKLSDQNSFLVKQLQEAQSQVVATSTSNQKVDQLNHEVEKGKEELAQLQAKLDHSEQVAKESLAKNDDIQKQLTEASEKLVAAQKQVQQAAPLKEKVEQLQAKVEQASTAVHRESALQADFQVLQEDRDRLAQKVTELGVLATEASKVKGLSSETETLKKTVADLKNSLDAGEKELSKAHAHAESSDKVSVAATALQSKNLADAVADRAVLQEDKERLQAKLTQAALLLNTLKSTADSVPVLKKDLGVLKDQLAENSKTMEQSAAKLAQAQQVTTASIDETKRKEQIAKSLTELLTQQNTTLQEQLKAALVQIANSVDHTPEAMALKEQIKKLQDQVDLNAKNYTESQRQLTELAKSQPDQQKALNEKEKALADAQGEASKLQSQLGDAALQIKTLKKQEDQGAIHLKELQDQLAEKDAKIARFKKKKGGAADEQMVQENDLLRGIVLREIKDEAKKAQAHRLMEEELKRLNVQSDTLQQQMIQLATPAVELTPQERALFKDAQLIVSDQGGANLEASISAPINGGGGNALANGTVQSETNAITANALVSSNGMTSNTVTLSNPVTYTNIPSPSDAAPALDKSPDANTPARLPWQGKFKQLLAQAKAEFDRQDYLQAENTFQESLKLSPNDYFALSNLGVVEFQLGKMKEAEEQLKKAVQQSSDSSFALTTLGIVHYRQQRLQDAELVLRKAVAINAQDFTAHNYLGIVLAASGKGKAGESEIMKAVEINPNYSDAHFNLAVIYATGKPPAKMMARKHYSKALELGSPPDPSLEHMLQ